MDKGELPENQASCSRCFASGILPLTPLDGGVDKECCEATKRKLSPRIITVNVRLLDDTVKMFHIQHKAPGQVLFDQVCRVLNLLESDYFGLEYRDDQKAQYWLDCEKSMCNQVGLNLDNAFLEFCVKFYTPDPGQLEEEFTRYLFSLQIKRDLAQGQLMVHEDTAALLASYIVQAACGDFSHDDYPNSSYLACHQFVPWQTKQLEEKIMLHHMNQTGQSPSEADMNLLEVARRCEFFGIRLVPAFDSEGIALTVAVGFVGIVVYRNMMKIHTFLWNKIRKLSFKRRKFLIKLHPTEGYGYHGKDSVEFLFDSRNASKSFWKRCIEHHAFFRCTEVRKACRVRGKTRIFSRGSAFRYRGRTQKQVIEYVRQTSARRRSFQRSSSFRLANPGSYPTIGGVSSRHSCSSMSQLRANQPTAPDKDSNNEELRKGTVCLSEPNTPQHRANISGDSIGKDETTSHESYHILNQSLDETALNTSLPLDTSRVRDASHGSDESPEHRRDRSESPDPRSGRQPRSRNRALSDLTPQSSVELNEVPYKLRYRRESNPRQKLRRHRSQPREARSRCRTSPEHSRFSRSSSERSARVNFARWGELPPADSFSSRDDSVGGTFETEIRERWTELRRQKERVRARQLWQQRSDIEKSLEAEEALEHDFQQQQQQQQQQQLPPSQQRLEKAIPSPNADDDVLHDFNRAQLLGKAVVVNPPCGGPGELSHGEPCFEDIHALQPAEEESEGPGGGDLRARLEQLEENLEEIELLKELEFEAVEQECLRLEETLAMNTELKEEYERALRSEGAEVMSLLQSLNQVSSEQQQQRPPSPLPQQTATLEQQEQHRHLSPATSISLESLVSPPDFTLDLTEDDDEIKDDSAKKGFPSSEPGADSKRDAAPLQPIDRASPEASAAARGTLRPSHIPQGEVRDGYAAHLQFSPASDPRLDPAPAAEDIETPQPRLASSGGQIQSTPPVFQEFCAEIKQFLPTTPGPSGWVRPGLEAPESTSRGAAGDDRGVPPGERPIETGATSALTFVVESAASYEKVPSSHIPHSSSSSSSSGTPPLGGRVFVKVKRKRLFAKPEEMSNASSSSSEIRLTLDEFDFLRRGIGKGRKVGGITSESLISSSEDVTFSDETEILFVGDEPKTLCNSPVSNPRTPIPDPDASLRLSKSSSEESSLDCAHEPHNTNNLNLI